MSKKPTKLKELKVFEVSLVDRGANQGANILLAKRKTDKVKLSPDEAIKELVNNGDSGMSVEDLQKQLDEAKAALEAITKERDEFEKTCKEKQTKEAGATIEIETEDNNEEEDTEMTKALEVQDLKKQMEDLQKRAEEAETIAKAERDARKMIEYAKKAEDLYPNVPGTSENKALLLKAIDAMPDELKSFAQETLKSHNEALSKAFSEIGIAQGLEKADSPVRQIEALAKAMQNSEGISYEQAYSKVLMSAEGRDLYGKI